MGKVTFTDYDSLRPVLQRRATELLATLGEDIAQASEAVAPRCGWKENPAARIWKTRQRSIATTGRRTRMGKLIYKGLSKPSDEIPQPISVVLGSNLRQGSKPSSTPPKQEDKLEDK